MRRRRRKNRGSSQTGLTSFEVIGFRSTETYQTPEIQGKDLGCHFGAYLFLSLHPLLLTFPISLPNLPPPPSLPILLSPPFCHLSSSYPPPSIHSPLSPSPPSLTLLPIHPYPPPSLLLSSPSPPPPLSYSPY